MSANGTKRTFRNVVEMSAFGGKADIRLAPITVFIGCYGLGCVPA
jgi:hypothetical protein